MLTPPLRHASHQEALWQAIASGLLDVVSTDHVPYSMSIHKVLGKESFDQIPNGAPGLETLLTLIVGTLSYTHPDLIGHTVWRHFGEDYGYFPLFQPLLGLIWLFWPETMRAYGIRWRRRLLG